MPKPHQRRSKTSKPRRQVASPAEGWYIIKDILDERRASGRVEYLVDWENNADTGEVYAPTWVRSSEVTELAKEEWEKAKAARAQVEKPPAPPVTDSDDSQPVSLSNWRTLQRADARSLVRPRPSDTPSFDRPDKPRLAHSATPSEEPVPSITSAPSFDSEDFDPPASQDPVDAHRTPQHLVVELPKDPHLDPSEFMSTAGTQPSLTSSQSLAELEDGDERLALASQLSGRTVPDSQAPSGPTWSQSQPSCPITTSMRRELRTQQPDEARLPDSSPPEISSRQPDQTTAPGGHGQHLDNAVADSRSASSLATSASYHQPASPNAALATPVFATQPPVPHTFTIPGSSLHSQNSEPSSHAAIPATATGTSQHLTGSCSHAELAGSQSQDAQVVSRDELASQVNVFSRSESIVQEHLQISDLSAASSAQRGNIPSGFTPPRPTKIDEMETPPKGRMSATEELSQLFDLENAMAIPDPAPAASLLEPRPDLPGGSTSTQPSSEESLQKMVDEAFSNPRDLPSGTMAPSEPSRMIQPTVSPADISRQTEAEMAALPSIPSPSSQRAMTPDLCGSSRIALQAAQAPCEESTSETSSDALSHLNQMEHIVTLPFQASLRSLYEETLFKSRKDVTEFGTIFNEIYVEPDQALVSRIDQLFGRLSNICDYPPDVVGTALENLPPSQLAKYACDSNSKFSFIFELLQGLYKDIKFLIVARSVELLRLLHHLAGAAKVECICEAIERRTSDYPTSAAQVTLVLPDEDVRALDFDVVVGFDRSFASSRISSRLEADVKSTDAKRPRVLTLVTTHSIEHIGLHVPGDMGPLERKNALLSGIVRARKLVSDPERGYSEPHGIASVFVEYFNGQTDTIISEPVPLPDEVLDIYLSSQSQPQMPLVSLPELEGRKRKLDDDNDVTVKTRILAPGQLTVEETAPPLPDDIEAFLKAVNGAKGTIEQGQMHVRVPVAVLQVLAEKFAQTEHQVAARDTEAEFRAVVSGLDKRIEEHERNANKLYSSHREALEDRSRFEAEKTKAEAALQAATAAAQKDSDKAQKRIIELEASVAQLKSGPDGQEGESPLVKANQLLKEAQEKAEVLEKRLENSRKDGEYVRNLYQEASSSASAAQAEIAELKEQNEKLRKKASESLVKIHQIQAENSSREFARQIGELKALIKERELELDRVREDLRQLRNGKRETRQVSVPRSPRMGVMSPRPGRTHGGSASRGTSPAPAVGLDGPLLPPGNGRWVHLRD